MDTDTKSPRTNPVSRRVTRRELLKLLPLAAVGTLAACAAPPAAAPAAPAATAPAAAPADATATAPPEATSGAPVTITWAFWGDPEEVKVHQAVADAFMAQDGTIKVEINTEPWTDYNTKLNALIASGEKLYDVFWYPNNVQALAEKGVIENLTPLAKQSTFNLEDYWPGTLAQATYNGDVYGLIRDADASILYYNKDIFTEAGVDIPTDTWTLDDLQAAAEKLTKVEASGRVERYGLAMEGGKIDAFLVGNGGGYVDNVENPSKSILDSKESLQVLDWFHTMIEKNFAMKPADLNQAGGDAGVFQKGQAAMIIQNASRIPAFNTANLNYDIAPLPLPWSGKRANQAGGARWLMDAKGEHKIEAWTFMMFLNSAKGGNGIYAKAGGMFPAQKSVVTSPEFTDPSQKPANRSVFATEGAGLAILTPGLLLPIWDDIGNNIVAPGLDKIWALETTPEKAVAEIVPAVNDALKAAGFPK